MKRRSLLIAAMVCLVTGSALAGNASAAENPANPLIGDRGLFRPLILVAPSFGDADYRRLRSRLDEHQADFNARKMVLYSVVGTQEGDRGQRAGKDMTVFETRALREALDVKTQRPLTVILVGLDGGKKMQLEGYVAPQKIFDIIDNMPMRNSEDRQ